MNAGEFATTFAAAALAQVPSVLVAPPGFLDNLPVAIYACDVDGRILWFNARAAELWGREPRIGDPSERYCGSYRLYFGGREITRDETPMAVVLRTGNPITGAEAKVIRPDGSSVWAMVHIEPIRSEAGQLIGAINCFHDTTDRRRAEALAHEQSQRLAATHDHADIGIAEIDADGAMLRVNAKLAALLGRSPEQLLGQSVFAPDLADDVEYDQAQFGRQVRGEIDRYTAEKRFRRADGTTLWISLSSSTVRDAAGNFLYAVRVQRDITEQKTAEETLARRAAEQTALFEFTAGLQYAETLDRIYALALSAIDRALRCDRTSILLFDGAGVMRFVAARGLSETYRQAVEGHSPWDAHTRNPSPIAIENIATADLPDELKAVVRAEGIAALAFIPIMQGGRLVGKFMTYYDRPHEFQITELDLALTVARQLGFAIERVRNEADRRRSERAAQQLAAIVESSQDAIVSKDLDGIIQTWNQGAERLFGYKAEEVIGRSITIVVPPDRPGEEAGILARIRRGERVDSFETVRQRKDGRLVNISLTISPVRDAAGRIVGASKIARDITERKKIEARLQDNERQLRDLLAAIPAALYTTDAKGKITYFNDAAVDLAGRVPVLGSDEWCVTWKLYWPDGTPLPHDQCPMAVALKEGRPIRNVEAIAERPDGIRVPFIPYPTPLRDADGTIVGAINMLVDVSERKQAETQQRILFNELNHRVKNNMQMLQSLLRLGEKQTANIEARQVLAEASSRVAAMAAAQQVLYATTNATRFDAGEFLDAVCKTLRPLFARPVAIICEAAEGEISNDAAMPLALILNELLTNAVKHGVDEGGATVRVGLDRSGEHFQLYVEDDGPGFDLSTVRQRSSGLQLVQGLARQLRGRFEVAREPRTRCSVYFS